MDTEDEAIFNYRLSQARRVIENAFGIIAARWRILMQPIQAKFEKTRLIIKSTICLHNFLRQTNCAAYCPTGFVDTYDETGQIKEGEWQKLVGTLLFNLIRTMNWLVLLCDFFVL